MLLGGIDKVEVIVPKHTTVNPELRTDFARVSAHGRHIAARQHYRAAFDLRTEGIAAVVFFESEHTGNHKIQIIEAGEKTYAQIVEIIEYIFAGDARVLQTYRVDLSVDVPGMTPFQIFQQVIISHKRKRDCIGTKYHRNVSCGIETYSFGERSSRIQIYDKIAELKERCKRINVQPRRMAAQTAICQELERLRMSGTSLTRVEHQFLRPRIPPELFTLEDLSKNTITFDPFRELHFLGTDPETELCQEGLGAPEYLKLRGFQLELKQHGPFETKKCLERLSPGYGSRIFSGLVQKLACRSAHKSMPELFQLYQQGLRRQLFDE